MQLLRVLKKLCQGKIKVAALEATLTFEVRKWTKRLWEYVFLNEPSPFSNSVLKEQDLQEELKG